MPWEDEGRVIESIGVEGVFAIVQRRAEIPKVSESELTRQHAIVLRIAETVPAVLPARFGTYVEVDALRAIVHDHLDIMRTALDLVRDRVQMTLRIAASPAAPGAATESSATASGLEYLRRRREQMFPDVPQEAQDGLRAVRAFVVDERRRPGENGVVSIYHLVGKTNVQPYRDALQ